MTLLVTSGSRSPAVGAVESTWQAPAAEGLGPAAMASPWQALAAKGPGPVTMAGPCRPPAAEMVRQLGHRLQQMEERQRALLRDLLLVAEGALRPSPLVLLHPSPLVLLLHTPSWC